MTTTPDNTATTWRSLTDQLTPSQVDKLAAAEKRSPLPDAEKAAALLDWAREWAQRNLDDHLMFSHISRPAVASAVYHCGERTDGRGWSREFVGTTRQVTGVTVYLDVLLTPGPLRTLAALSKHDLIRSLDHFILRGLSND